MNHSRTSSLSFPDAVLTVSGTPFQPDGDRAGKLKPGDTMITEAEWLACTEPQPMLVFLGGKASDRKLRLFACACVRRVWSLLYDKHSRKALTIAERYADGEVSAEKLHFAWGDARRAAQVAYRQKRETAEPSAMWAVSMVCEADITKAVAAVEFATRCEAYPGDRTRFDEAQKHQLPLLRDIFGNPFRPVRIDPSWLMPKVIALAQQIYENRAFDRMPRLADALEGAGCRNNDIVGHFRAPGPHVRGCWALDLILGKE
jgi:hypothetical protein